METHVKTLNVQVENWRDELSAPLDDVLRLRRLLLGAGYPAGLKGDGLLKAALHFGTDTLACGEGIKHPPDNWPSLLRLIICGRANRLGDTPFILTQVFG